MQASALTATWRRARWEADVAGQSVCFKKNTSVGWLQTTWMGPYASTGSSSNLLATGAGTLRGARDRVAGFALEGKRGQLTI